MGIDLPAQAAQQVATRRCLAHQAGPPGRPIGQAKVAPATKPTEACAGSPGKPSKHCPATTETPGQGTSRACGRLAFPYAGRPAIDANAPNRAQP